MTKVLENIDGGKMIWGIGEYNESADFNADYRAIVKGEQLEDGIVNLKVRYMDVMTTASVVVSGGMFHESTIDIIGTAANNTGYWGPYIEGFERTEHGIEVFIGS